MNICPTLYITIFYMDTSTYSSLAFSYCLGIGPVRFKQLRAHFGSADNAYNAKESELATILGAKLAHDFIIFRSSFKSDSIISQLSTKHIQVISLGQDAYPKQLAQISDPPICLYVKGNVKALHNADKMFGIVGTRKASSYGLQVTQIFTKELVAYGFTIVSGLALGIDSKAHTTCVEAGGATIAVLGCGVDIIYPTANKQLYKHIIESGGAIISEFPPGHTVSPGLFIARNRIIAGLSRGILVVEGAKNSGALTTARYAAEQGRDVFAPPVPMTSTMSFAPHLLLKEGARLALSPTDIIEEYGVFVTKKTIDTVLAHFTGISRDIIERLLIEAASPDDLKLLVKKPIIDILNCLSRLELENIVAKNSEGKYYLLAQ